MECKTERKVVIVGKYCVGKTALVDRFTENKFDELSSYQATIGAAFASKRVSVGTNSVTLGIWDTAGSERFESMSSLYYRGAKAAVVCYDITDGASFEKAKFYLNELEENSPDCMLYLCGTKSDLVSSGKRARDVSYDEVVEYGRGMNARIVIETSSKTGHNVEELFTRMAEDLIETQTGDLGQSTDKLGLDRSTQQNRRLHCGCKS